MTNPIISGPITNSGSSIVTIFIVGTKASTGGLYDSMLALNLSPITNYYGAGTLFACYYGGTSPPQFYCYMSGNLSLSFVGAVNTPFIFNAFQTGTTGSTFGNGTSYGNVTTAGSTFNYTTYYIGLCTGGPAWVGNICEIIVYNSILSISQRQQVESYLAQKWGIGSSLPVAHPGLTSTVYQSSYLKTAGVKTNIARMVPFYTGFTPRQIGGLALWLDAADSSTISFSSGSNVSTWSDKSGNGRNATVYAGTPTYTSALGMTFNGSSSLQITYTASPILESMFVIVKFNSVSGQGDILSGIASGQREYLMYVPYSPGTIYLGRHSTGPSGAINGGTVTTGSNYLLGYVFNGTGNTISFFQSGNTITSGTPQFTYSAGGTISLIGSYNGGGYLQGQIYEMIIYSTALSITERQQVESYLAQKWGLASSLPAGHSHLTQPAGARTALSLANSKFSLTPLPSYTLKYTYTGSNQSFVVPSGITSVNVYMWGAGGGAGLGAGGGAGCYVQGVLTVTPGETLTIVVGQGGGNKASSFGKTYGGGGAGGGLDNGRSDIVSSQGGGRSAIVRSSTDLVTAAAGGGGRGGRGGRGKLVTGENGTGAATGGSQTAGGTNNGAIYSGGNANQDNSAGGGSGYYGGGGGGQDQAGGGGSCLTSNLSLLVGQSTYGTESSNGVLAPQTSSPYYNSDVAFGATTSYGYNYGSGGNGLVVISFSSKTTVATLTYSRLILSAWYGSVAYRYGLDVTTLVNNAFGGNPSNTITLSLATFTDPQVGTTKYTYIVYMFNGIQKFSSPYAEGTVLTFSSLT